MNALNNFSNKIGKIIKFCAKRQVGDKMLYELCDKKNNEWGKAEILADKIWLIGRAFSASPERRNYSKRNDSKNTLKIKHGKGTGEFFLSVAQNILLDNSYFSVREKIDKLENLKFDKSDGDKQNIVNAVKIVSDFNALCVKSIMAYDGVNNKSQFDLNNSKNNWSFSSKFLHFHLPKNVFILDRYSKDGCKVLFGKQRTGKWVCEDFVLNDEIIQYFIKSYNDFYSFVSNEFSGKTKQYAEHCVKEYLLCCFLKENLSEDVRNYFDNNYVRLADRICQRI